MMRAKNQQQHFTPVLGNFVSIAALWDERGDALFPSGHRPFPSEVAARWFIRMNRETLLEAEAIAKHVGRIVIDPARFEATARAVALQAARPQRPQG